MTTIIVIKTIDTPTPASPNIFMLNEAAMLEAEILANILPIRIVIRRFVGWSRRDSTTSEFLTLSIFRRLMLILLRLKSEVSEPEKKADRNNNIRSTIKWYHIFYL
jgi:hypothetical protein